MRTSVSEADRFYSETLDSAMRRNSLASQLDFIEVVYRRKLENFTCCRSMGQQVGGDGASRWCRYSHARRRNPAYQPARDIVGAVYACRF